MILLDTHVVVWLALEPGRISKKAKSAIEEARAKNEELAISDMTLFEIANLSRKARIGFNKSLESFLAQIESRFVVLPVNSEVCARAMTFGPDFPRDPADRVIAATALVNGISLISADRALLSAREVSTIW